MHTNKYHKGFLTDEMRMYVAKCISDTREIRCEKCGAYDNLEFHHKRYEGATIKDIQILCEKCHRNVKRSDKSSHLKTVFERGKRFCEGSKWRFEY